MGARATVLFAVAALCASFAFAFAAVALGEAADGTSDVVAEAAAPPSARPAQTATTITLPVV